jgi:hypothetical protein
MLVSEMIVMLTQVLADFGDKEMILVEEGTGEVRYLVGASIDPGCDEIMLEHVSSGEKEMIDTLNALEEMFGC